VPQDKIAPQSSKWRDRASKDIAQYFETRHSTASGEIRQHSTSSQDKRKHHKRLFIWETPTKEPRPGFFFSRSECARLRHTRGQEREGERVRHHIVYEHLDEKEYAREENTREQGREEDSKHHHHFYERLGKHECVRERHTRRRGKEGGDAQDPTDDIFLSLSTSRRKSVKETDTHESERRIEHTHLFCEHLDERECARERHTRGRGREGGSPHHHLVR